MWKKNVKDDLPDIDREVVALQRMASGSYKVIYAHRPNPNGYVIVGGEKLYAKTYDGWNQPDVEWWLDLDLPFNED